MTLFAGMFARTSHGRAQAEAAFAALSGSLSRKPGVTPEYCRSGDISLAWIAGAGEAGGAVIRTGDGHITLVSGDPVLDCISNSRSMAADHARVHALCSVGDPRALAVARGFFCAVHFDPSVARLWLVADQLALRPVYYIVDADFVLFASALRMLEGHPLVRQVGTLQASAEVATLGFPLGTRTVLADVQMLTPAQVIEVTTEAVRIQQYRYWDRVSAREAPIDAACEELHATFRRAVQLRLGDSQEEAALLSGGLDSRVVVGVLRALGVNVQSINYAPPRSADLVLGREAARALGTKHFEVGAGVPETWQRLAYAYECWREAAHPGDNDGRRLWSGDGGDRVIAPVNLSPIVVAQLRAGEVRRAINTYLMEEHVALPRRLFRESLYEQVRELHLRGIEAEISRLDCKDPGRRFHLYVLGNESRGNIRNHFEDYDLHGIEIVMPFYDSEFVKVALSHSFDMFLQHRLYLQWLQHLPAAIGSVPWQAYPTSLPCPLPMPEGLQSQWEAWHTPAEAALKRRRQREAARDLLRHRPFPGWLVNRPVLWLAWALACVGIDNYSHLFGSARPFVRYPPEGVAAGAH